MLVKSNSTRYKNLTPVTPNALIITPLFNVISVFKGFISNLWLLTSSFSVWPISCLIKSRGPTAAVWCVSPSLPLSLSLPLFPQMENRSSVQYCFPEGGVRWGRVVEGNLKVIKWHSQFDTEIEPFYHFVQTPDWIISVIFNVIKYAIFIGSPSAPLSSWVDISSQKMWKGVLNCNVCNISMAII